MMLVGGMGIWLGLSIVYSWLDGGGGGGGGGNVGKAGALLM